MVATAKAGGFASIYPSAGSFITYITRAIGTKVAVAVGVITILGYIIAFGGIYIFVGSISCRTFRRSPRLGLTQIVTIAYGVLVVAPVVIGLKFGVGRALRVRGHPAAGDEHHHPGPRRPRGLSGTPFTWPRLTDVLLTFASRCSPSAGSKPPPRWPRRPATPGATCHRGHRRRPHQRRHYVVGSYALVTAFGVGRTSRWRLIRTRSTPRPRPSSRSSPRS